LEKSRRKLGEKEKEVERLRKDLESKQEALELEISMRNDGADRIAALSEQKSAGK